MNGNTPSNEAQTSATTHGSDVAPSESPDASPLIDKEGQWLLRHCQGDRQAFGQLVAAYRGPIFSYLSRCGVALAQREDLFQDIFIKIHRAAHRYEAHRPLHPWIFTIVANTVRNHLRKKRVRQLIFATPNDLQEPEDTAPNSERRSAARQNIALIEMEIRKLKTVQRQVVLLVSKEKLPLKDVAQALDIPVNTVKTHLRRARIALAQALDQHHRPNESSP